jgi:hypothetical protein
MKPVILSCLVVWLAFNTVQAATAIGNSFSYQGMLQENGSAASGHYDIRFALYDAAVGGSQISSNLVKMDQVVSNGAFTVMLDFGAVFEGTACWLEIAVRTHTTEPVKTYEVLGPRQLLCAAPYSLYASMAGGLTASASQNFLLRSGDSMSGNLAVAGTAALSFGNTARQMLNLWGTDYGIGVQSDCEYFRSHNDFAWYQGGTHNNTRLSAGGGDRLMYLTSDGLNVAGTVTASSISANDNAIDAVIVSATGSGDGSTAVSGRTFYVTKPTATMPAVQFGDSASSVGVKGLADSGTGVLGHSTEGVGVIGQLGNGTRSIMQAAMWGITFDTSGNGVVGQADNGNNARGVWGRSTAGYGGYFQGGFGGVYGESTSGHSGWFKGNVFIEGDSTLSRPHLELHEYQTSDFARLRLSAQGHAFWDIAAGGGANDLNFYNSTNGDVMSLKENGNLHVRVLTITGGADLAEPFKVAEVDLAKGSVVVIDEEQPGRLRLSTEAYDTRVAGIISGANGINPGLSMSQQTVMEGGQQVALSGRVYVKADATAGPIKPGDLLTTSSRPGHAMKASDPSRAQGAILGKAMTPLKDGTGLVLVLVTLQ